MTYRFGKNIEITVEADSLEQATEFVKDVEKYDDAIEDFASEAIYSTCMGKIKKFNIYFGRAEHTNNPMKIS